MEDQQVARQYGDPEKGNPHRHVERRRGGHLRVLLFLDGASAMRFQRSETVAAATAANAPSILHHHAIGTFVASHVRFLSRYGKV